MPVNWALGLPQGNPAESFQNAYDKGVQRQRQEGARNALSTLVQNPNDTAALGALAKADPATAMDFRKQQAEMLKLKLGEHYDSAVKGGLIIRQMQPKDEASWQQVLAAAHQAGIPLDGVPLHWDQNTAQYAQQLGAIASAAHPEAQDPGIIREFDEATKRGLIPPGTPFTQYVQMRSPNMSSPVTIPYGATVSGGGAPAGGGLPRVSSPDEAAKLPPGSQFILPDGRIGTVPGGAGGNASGGFPRPY
jgi:hypothetical protein